jgi:hypothetical protein
MDAKHRVKLNTNFHILSLKYLTTENVCEKYHRKISIVKIGGKFKGWEDFQINKNFDSKVKFHLL